ncbi:DNA polymerase III subunit delta [Pseudoclavibacter helvolus]|uniref:DNA polymerase III subunit delta n=1 Tax=Pseudoclavibacter helvolus TaxID=255205 RepID=UPI0024AD6C1F|nr:DNA polymerase III subunit delta [Pseudoclavibacter helvolus]
MAQAKRASTPKRAIPVLTHREVRPAGIVLVSGPEDYFAETAITRLRDVHRAESPDLEITEIDASGYSSGHLTTLVSPSLFFEPRLVIIRGVQQCTDALIADVVDYTKMPVEGATLVLRHGGGVRGKKLLDAVRAAKDVAIEIDCQKPKPSELVDVVVAEVRNAGRRIEPQAAALLVAAFNTDLAELIGAARQLLTVTSDTITDEHVDKYFGGRVETTGFKIADAALAGRVRDALALVRHGFSTGLHPVPIVSAVASKLRIMAKVQGLSGSDAQIASRAGASPWQVGQARRELRDWDDASLGRAITLVAETDHAVKGAGKDPQFAVERMLRCIALRDV